MERFLKGRNRGCAAPSEQFASVMGERGWGVTLLNLEHEEPLHISCCVVGFEAQGRRNEQKGGSLGDLLSRRRHDREKLSEVKADCV
jgi:hypothetical protein